MSNWEILVPESSTNYDMNPIAGTTGNYTDVAGGTTTRVTTYSYLGHYSFRLVTVNDNDGVIFTLSALPNAIAYVTLRTYGAVSGWDWSLDNATYNVPALLNTEGDWCVYGFSFPAAQANGSTTLRIYQKGATALDEYLGHIQVESKAYHTTPITGDLPGCKWTGAAHASTSTRDAQDRSGGRWRDMESVYGLKVRFNNAIGMPPAQHISQPQVLLPGALYRGRKVLSRVQSLKITPTTTNADEPAQHSKRKAFINVIKPDLVKDDQPFWMRYWGANSTRPVKIGCVYEGGLEYYAEDNVEQPDVRIVSYEPYYREEGEGATTLTSSLSVADADYVVKRIAGTWSNVSTEFNGGTNAIVKGHDGCIYIGGVFTNVGDANGDYIVKYDPATGALSSLGTGLNQACYALAVAPNGDIYAGGIFTSAGGVANTVRIAYWDVSADVWMPLSTGIASGGVNCLVFGQSGILYVGGSFINHVDANGDKITQWDGSAFSSLGSGLDDYVNGLAVGIDGSLYAVGEFTASGAVTLNNVGRWDGTAWNPLGSGLASGGSLNCNAVVVDQAGNVYVTGVFATANGVSATNIAKWNGTAFEALGSGVNSTGFELALSDTGLLYVGGDFTTAGGLALADRCGVWNGSTWAHLPANLPGSPAVSVIFPDGDDLYVGYNTIGTATTSYLNTITNSGTTSTYPKFVFTRSGGTSAIVEWIKNETTGDTLWCNYSLLDGETLTIDLTPGKRSITSDFQGDVTRAVLRNSDNGKFKLLPGANSVSVFVNNTGATVTVYETHPILHWSVDGAAA